MKLLPLNFRFGSNNHQRRLAEQIAEHSLGDVIRRTTGLTPDMSTAEARGYIRARAARVVNREVMLTCRTNRRLQRINASQLAIITTEILIDKVLRENRLVRRTMAA